VLVLIGLCLFAFNLGELKVSVMEARNFIVAREMITEQHWLLTTMNNIARYEKPPFPAWFTTPFAYIFGLDNVWAYRIPTSIFSILGLVYFYKLVKIWLTKDIAFYAALILGTSFYYIVIRFEAPSDMYTHVSMVMALYFLLKDHPRIYLKNIILGSFFLGVSILAKGPVSLYALFLPFILAYSFSFKFSIKRFIPKVILFVLLGLIIGGSWYVFVRLKDPSVFSQIAEKETKNWINYEVKPFYYYWSFFIQSGIWTIPAVLSLAYPYFKKRIKHQKQYKFSFLWTIIALILLSVIPEKKPRYLVPVLFPLALNTVLVIEYLVSQKHNLFSKIFYYQHYGIIVLVCAAIILVPPFLNLNWENIWWLYLLMGMLALGILFFTFRLLSQQYFRPLIWSNVLLILLVTCVGQKTADLFQQNEDYKLLNVKGMENKKVQTYYYISIPPEVIWEYGEISKPWSEVGSIKSSFRILVSENYLENFKDNYPDVVSKADVKTFDRNYYRTGKRKHARFITHVFEVQN
jgi:4-amino-4-deoxy-L-arabinose transferase-like glycosyltransferase